MENDFKNKGKEIIFKINKKTGLVDDIIYYSVDSKKGIHIWDKEGLSTAELEEFLKTVNYKILIKLQKKEIYINNIEVKLVKKYFELFLLLCRNSQIPIFTKIEEIDKKGDLGVAAYRRIDRIKEKLSQILFVPELNPILPKKHRNIEQIIEKKTKKNKKIISKNHSIIYNVPGKGYILLVKPDNIMIEDN